MFKVKTKTRLLNTVFLISFDLHSTGKNSFHSYLMKMFEYFHLTNFNADLLDTAKVKHILSLMKQAICFILATHPSAFQKTRIL